MAKWFFTDFDGTLRNSRNNDLKLNPDDHQFVLNFIEKGNILAVATARPYMQIKKFLKQHYNLRPDYLICSNGSCVYDKSGNLLYDNPIPKLEQKELFDTLKKYEENVIGLIYTTINKEEVLFHKTWNEELKDAYFGMMPENKSLESLEQADILSMRIIVEENLKVQIERFAEKFRLTIGQYIFNFNDGIYIDITSIKTTKGQAIRQLQKLTKFDDKDVIVAGDDVNDFSMFEEFYENSYLIKQERNATFRSQAKKVIEQIHEIEVD
ncbi:HAD-IIB family hydrolase [Mesoplasma syrphidae]|nr:HAD-IIB family hydrolase [Mesoplasma syrphidae]